MSKLTFATTVLANIGLLKNIGESFDWPTMLVGMIGTIAFAYTGNRVLKF